MQNVCVFDEKFAEFVQRFNFEKIVVVVFDFVVDVVVFVEDVFCWIVFGKVLWMGGFVDGLVEGVHWAVVADVFGGFHVGVFGDVVAVVEVVDDVVVGGVFCELEI